MSAAEILRSFGLFAVLFFSAIPVSAFSQNEPFDVEADTLTYRHATQDMEAEGNVRVIQTSSTLTADYLRYERAKGRFWGRGNVILREKMSVLAGDEMEYDLLLEKGLMRGGKGKASPWYFQGGLWEKEQDLLIGQRATFTSCELPDAHFHFESSRVSLIPEDFFWAWGNQLNIDRTPFLYSPFLYKSLGPRKLVFQATPGSDQVKGAFAKTKTTYRFTDQVYTRFLYDYYTKSGSGLGNEFFYKDQENYKGSLFGYYIDPKGSPQLVGAPKAPQYNIRFYHWQRISNELTLQSNTNLRKNVSFNNQFFPQDYNQSLNDLISSIALTHQNGRLNQRLVVERLDAPDSGSDPLFADTHMQTASLPRYEFTLFQKPLWSPMVSSTSVTPNMFGPLQFSMGGSAGNTYSRVTERVQSNANTNVTLSQSIVFNRQWSFNPSITPSLRWQDKYSPEASQTTTPTGTSVVNIGAYRGFQGRAATSNVLRYRPSSSLTIDNAYNWTGRLKPNAAGLDRSADDGGIETHNVTPLVYWRPSRRIQLRSFSGYDLRRIANENKEKFEQRRISPWTSELTVLPARSNSEYFFRYSLGYNPVRTMQWEASIRGRSKYNTYYETGMLYAHNDKASVGVLTWNNRLGLFLSPGWRVDAVLNSLVPDGSGSNRGTSRIIQSEFTVTRNLHCWQAQFIYRHRPPFTREYGILLSLKFGSDAERDLANADLESQFYPWRYRDNSKQIE